MKPYFKDIEDKKIAKTLLKYQFDVYLNSGLSYNDFWSSPLSDKFCVVLKEFFERYKSFYANKPVATNDFTNHTRKAEIRLYGNHERKEEQNTSNQINYHEIIRKSSEFINEHQIENKPLMSIIGIPSENGFQNWHWEYLKLIFEESDKYEKNRDKYSFNPSFLENDSNLSKKTAESSSPISNPITDSQPIVSEKLKILMLTANPANTTKLNLDREHSMITLKLQNKQDKFNLMLRKAVSATEFKEFTETEKPTILHGIIGYLNDAVVAQKIYDALVS